MPNPESVLPKLLVVDGSPMMHRIMELTFAPEGIQVITESDGDQAIALLPIVRPDIVIADHALAGTSGYEVAAFVRNHPDLANVPVLLLASPFEPLDRVRAEASGVAGEISKPFEPGQLVARVRELLARSAEQRASRRPVRSAEETAAPGDARASALKLVEPAVPAPRGALDDYFDRLDAALERLDDQVSAREEASAVSVAGSDRAGDDDVRVPTLDRLLGNEEGPPRGAVLIDHPLRGAYATLDAPADHAASAVGTAASSDPPPAPAAPRGSDLGALVDALEALRRRESTVETPEPASPAVDPPAADSTVLLSEAVLDEITRRVLERLAPGAVNQVAIDVVTKVAERLLREEIARLSRPTTMS